jgi:hypothetical protein
MVERSARPTGEHEYATKQDVETKLIGPTERVMDESIRDLEQARTQGDASRVGFAEREVLRSAAHFAESHRIHQHVPNREQMGQAYEDVREVFDDVVKDLNQAKDGLESVHGRIASGEAVDQDVYMDWAEAAFIAEYQLRDARDRLYEVTTPVIPGKDDYDFVHLVPDREGPNGPEAAVLDTTAIPDRNLDQARERMIAVCEFDATDPRAPEMLTPEQQSQHVEAVLEAVESFRSMQQNDPQIEDGRGQEQQTGVEGMSAEEVSELRSVVSHDFPTTQHAHGRHDETLDTPAGVMARFNELDNRRSRAEMNAERLEDMENPGAASEYWDEVDRLSDALAKLADRHDRLAEDQPITAEEAQHPGFDRTEAGDARSVYRAHMERNDDGIER